MRQLAIVAALCAASGVLSCRFNPSGVVPGDRSSAPGDQASSEGAGLEAAGPSEVSSAVDRPRFDVGQRDRPPPAKDQPRPLDKPKPPPDKPQPDRPWPCASACSTQKCCFNTSSSSWSCANPSIPDHCLCDPVSEEPCKSGGAATGHTRCVFCRGAFQCWQWDLLGNCP